MGKSTIVPFGPQHPVLPEPIHLDLELKDEKVVKAIPSIGYIHRGLEMKANVQEGVKVYEYALEEGDFHAENIRIGNGEIPSFG